MRIDRQAVYDKYDGRCAYCGEEILFKDMQVDHIVPKFRFHQFAKKVGYDVDDIINLNPACRVCNKWKAAWLLDEFRNEIELQGIRLRKYSAQFRFAERYGILKTTFKTVKFYFERTP